MNKKLLHRLQTLLVDQSENPAPTGMGFFPAAVLIPLVEEKGQLSLLFEVRASQLSWQPGEICFPGGRVEALDNSSQAPAVRETTEELGISAQQIKVLGELSAVVSPLGVILKPHVGIIKDSHYNLSVHEVAEVFTVPLDFLLAAEPLTAHMEMGNRPLDDFPFALVPHYKAEWQRRRTYEVLFYQYQEHVIWGLTAQVLAEFLTLYRKAAISAG